MAGDAGAVRALMFDLGGVVIDLDFGRVLRAWAADAGCDAAVLRRRFTIDEAYQRHERGELDASGYFASLRRSMGLNLSDERFTAGWNDIYLGPVAGMPAMLAAAGQHLPLYAFTNSNPTHQRVWSTRFAAQLSVFRSVFVSSELGLRKPDPAAFAAVAQQAGLRTREILFFDDTAENVSGARAAGMHAVLVRSSRDVHTALLRLGVAAGPAGRKPPARSPASEENRLFRVPMRSAGRCPVAATSAPCARARRGAAGVSGLCCPGDAMDAVARAASKSEGVRRDGVP